MSTMEHFEAEITPIDRPWVKKTRIDQNWLG